jgi:hypothetical protein
MLSTDHPSMPTGATGSPPPSFPAPVDIPLDAAADTAAASNPRPRRLLRRVGAAAAAVVVVAAGVAYWALDEYVIDHVAIDDVAAYEAEVQAAADAAAAEAASEPSDPATDDSGARATAIDLSSAARNATASAPVITDTTYENGSMSISISTVVTG